MNRGTECKGAIAPLVLCFKKDGKIRCCIIPEFPLYYDFEKQDLEDHVEDEESDNNQEQFIILAKDSQSLVESIDSSD
jgi:hypothetical protein